MAYEARYAVQEPDRATVDAMDGPVLLEFGAPWCGYCRAAQPDIAQALIDAPSLRHLKIEDGRGQPLGRSFRVTLWPTLVLVEHGVERGRCVRPRDAAEVARLLAATAPPQA